MPVTLPSGIRQYVFERANGRCEYCQIPSGYSAYKHQIDHIIAQQHGGGNELDNLALACFHCNNKKGTNLSSYDAETNQAVLLFHPRTQKWDEHFIIEDYLISGLTITGRVTIKLLDMNNPRQLEIRQALIEYDLW